MKINKLFVSVSIIILSILNYTPISASEGIVFEEYFNNGFNNWDLVRGNFSQWSVNNGKAEVTVPTNFIITELSPKDSLWPDNLKYYEHSLEYTPLQGLDRNISFGFENTNNWYELHFTNSTYFVKLKNGSVIWSKTSNFRMFNGQTYKFKISLTEGNIKVVINDTELFDESNPSFTTFGKISIKAGTGAVAPTKVQFDNIIVRNLEAHPEPETLPVTLLKQTDPRWKNFIYDHALQWAKDPTIGAWGCAMTSMVMIMDYHGITLFPDGTAINPQTLNEWLINQKDGYLNGGLLNWFAVTRLTKQIANQYNTVKLEYSKSNGSDIAAGYSELQNNKPIILQMPGHFLVGTGIADNNDFFINDPFYAFNKFSQHNKPLLSTRLFQPSHTDLSGIVASAETGAEINLFRVGVLVGTSILETVTNPNDALDSSTVPVLELSKPLSGEYLVEYKTQLPFQKINLNLHLYDKDGNVQSIVENVISNSDQLITIYFSYNETSVSFPKKLSSFQTLKQDLDKLYLSDSEMKKDVLFGLSRIFEQVEQTPLHNQLRALRLFQQKLVANKTQFTDAEYNYLMQEVRALETTLTSPQNPE